MNYTQNRKISQITPSTLIIGIDIAKTNTWHGHKTIEELNLENA
jgi:tRNA G46 methylase TrmB